jgi:hypothetical protein
MIKTAWIACLLAHSAAFSSDATSWLNPPPVEVGKADKQPVGGQDIFEVVASKLATAISDLNRQQFIPITEKEARYFTGHYYTCPAGKKPFLVRAIYAFGGTGRFRATRIDQAVWILHESLGDGESASKSALVLNLDFAPTSIYVTVSSVR